MRSKRTKKNLTEMNRIKATGAGGFSTFLRATVPSLCNPTHVLLLSRRGPRTRRSLTISSSSSSSSSLPPSLNPVSATSPPTPSLLHTPLFLRPPAYSAQLSELQMWHDWAKSLAASVGTSFLDSDHGPDSSLLCRELRWLLEDALHPEEEGGGDVSSSSTIVDPSSILQPISGFPSTTSSPQRTREVKLRASIDDLYCLWRQRIEERRPFQYLVGCEHWRDLVLCVQEGVLIPRPETEILVDLVEDVISRDIAGLGMGEESLWADLGTGTGAIAIGIARSLLLLPGPGRSCRKVIATDMSPVAVQVASFNVQRYGLQDVVEVRQGSWFEPLKDVQGKLSGLVSNPPYIPSQNIPGLQAEVGRHEPHLALDGGVDGMDCLLHLCHGAASMLSPGGFFAFETNGEKQCKFLVEYLEKQLRGNFFDVKVVPDFAGIQRFVTGFRR